MTTLVLYLMLCHNPLDLYFPGYTPIPNPKPEDLIIIPLGNPTPALIVSHDPVRTA